MLIAENNDLKMEFAQKEGFRKILNLLLSKEERVYQVISKALLHFLHIENSKSPFISKIENVEEKVNFFFTNKLKNLLIFSGKTFFDFFQNQENRKRFQEIHND